MTAVRINWEKRRKVMSIDWGSYKKTKVPGIRRRPEDGALVVRVRQTDPRTGKRVERCKTVFSGDMEEALVAREKMIKEVKGGPLNLEDAPGQMTLTAYGQRWLVRRRDEGDRPHTIQRYLVALERFVCPVLGHLKVDELTSHHIVAWRDWLLRQRKRNGEPYSGWTLAAYFSVLRTVLRDASLEMDLTSNPMTNVRGISKARSPRAQRFLNRKQLGEFLDHLYRNHYDHFAMSVLMAAFGLRFEEVSGLHVGHIDEVGMEIQVAQANIRGAIFPTKTGVVRRLPLDDGILRLLKEHMRFLEGKKNRGFLDEDILFPSRLGGYRFTTSVHKAYDKVSGKLGLGWNVRAHDLRRTAVNLLRQANVGDIIQRSLVGHSSVEMTEHYSSVTIGEKREAHSKVLSMLSLRFKKAGD
jgi:integrase